MSWLGLGLGLTVDLMFESGATTGFMVVVVVREGGLVKFIKVKLTLLGTGGGEVKLSPTSSISSNKSNIKNIS